MGTSIRTEVSKDNPYYISKHRYLELKHFCLQYDEWEKLWREIPLISGNEIAKIPGGKNPGKPVENLAIKRMTLERNMQMVWKVCEEADKALADYIFKAVTDGVSYVWLSMHTDIPCGKDMFYDRYRRFFWLLDGVRR